MKIFFPEKKSVIVTETNVSSQELRIIIFGSFNSKRTLQLFLLNPRHEMKANIRKVLNSDKTTEFIRSSTGR